MFVNHTWLIWVLETKLGSSCLCLKHSIDYLPSLRRARFLSSHICGLSFSPSNKFFPNIISFSHAHRSLQMCHQRHLPKHVAWNKKCYTQLCLIQWIIDGGIQSGITNLLSLATSQRSLEMYIWLLWRPQWKDSFIQSTIFFKIKKTYRLECCKAIEHVALKEKKLA